MPLSPGQKTPFLEDWPHAATHDPDVVRAWAKLYPEANCGAVTDSQEAAGTWILDVDSPIWFLDACPVELPDTFVVRTGGGGLQLHFKHDANSRTKLRNRAVENPARQQPGEKENLLEVLWDRRQGLVPGCLHPNGKTYEVFRDQPLQTASPRFVDWLLQVSGSKTQATQKYLNPLQATWDPQLELAKAGLKFQATERDGKVYLNYHVLHGKCLVKGSTHEPNRSNNNCCAFVFRPDNREFWHQCFAAGCDPMASTAVALRGLGLELKSIVDPGLPLSEALKSFKWLSTLDQSPLEFLVEGFMAAEAVTALAGLSGHLKTWLALSLAKALVLGRPLWDLWPTRQTPVMYLVPEVGARSFRHRLLKLRGETWADDPTRFVCRTFSEGETLGPSAPEVLAVARGRVVFLDTTIRFVEGDENVASDNQRGLAEGVLGLLAHGAAGVVILHHSPKSFRQETEMYLENMLRGTGDIGAMVGCAYGIRLLDPPEAGVVHVECLKPRDFEGPAPFQLAARPYIDEEGDLKMVSRPGETTKLGDHVKKGGRPASYTKEQAQLVLDLKSQGKSARDIAKTTGLSRSAVSRLIQEELL